MLFVVFLVSVVQICPSAAALVCDPNVTPCCDASPLRAPYPPYMALCPHDGGLCTCVPDQDGANDFPGQKDVTQLCWKQSVALKSATYYLQFGMFLIVVVHHNLAVVLPNVYR